MSEAVIVALITAGASIVVNLIVVVASSCKTRSIVREGLRDSLYFSIRQSALDHIHASKISGEDLEAILSAYKTYKDLGGNGYAEALIAKVKALPLA